MRKIFTLCVLSVGLMFLTSSCSKTSQSEDMVVAPSSQVVNAAVAANGTYELVLANWSNASISKQAAHFKSSATEVDLKTGKLVYRYTPAVDFSGDDEVTLTTKTAVSSSEHNGCGRSNGDDHTNGASGSISYANSSMTIRISVH